MHSDIFVKLENVMVYTTRELPEDPVIEALMAQRSRAVMDEDIRSITAEVTGPVLLEGQVSGVVRTDVPIRELIDFLVEQTYLAAGHPDRSEDAARHQFRKFVAPVLRAQSVSHSVGSAECPDDELGKALSAATDAVAAAHDAAARLRLRCGGIPPVFDDR